MVTKRVTNKQEFEDNRRGWHVDRTLNISHILGTIVLALSAFSWANAIDKQVAMTQQQVDFLQKQQLEESQKLTSFRTEIRDDLRTISVKMDAAIENKRR